MKTLIRTYLCIVLLLFVNTLSAQLYDFAQDVIDEIGVTDPAAQVALAATMEVAGINDSNWIVGHYTAFGNIRRLFVWSPPIETTLPDGDVISTPPQTRLLASGNELEAVGISNNGTVVYNVIESIVTPEGSTEDVIVGYVSRYELNTDTYLPGVGTSNLQMKAISENWIAGDFHIKDDSFFDPFSTCPLFSFVDENPFAPILASGFQLTNFTRAMAINLDGDMTPSTDKQIAFIEALTCNLPSRAYAIKASPNGELQYVGGESYGRGEGEERYTNAHAFVYSNEQGNFFQTTEVIGGTPGQVLAVNNIGEIAGTWFTPSAGDNPNSLRGFRSTVAGCPDIDSESLPFIDLVPDANVLPNSINDAGLVVGTYNTGVARAFIYTNTFCQDPLPIPTTNPPSGTRFDPSNTDLSFKDLTNYAKKEVGILGWEQLSTAKAINSNDWIVGRGLDPNGNQRPYLLSFPLCDKVPRQGLTGKGDYEFCDANYFNMPIDLMTSIRKTIFNSNRLVDRPGVISYEGSRKIFFDNGRNQGWFVDQVPINGPGDAEPTEPVELATNIGPFYENNAHLEIISDRILVPAGVNSTSTFSCDDLPQPNNCFVPPIPEVVYSYEEIYLRFKVFSQLENVYDRVSIDVRVNPLVGSPTAWVTCATIAHTFDENSPYAFQEPLFSGETADDGWADYMVDLSKYAGHRIQLRLRFDSDRCNVGGGVQMKDFQLIGISNDYQNLLFEELIGEAFVETVLDRAIEVLYDLVREELLEGERSVSGRANFVGPIDPTELATLLQKLKGVKAGTNVAKLLDAMGKAKAAAGAGGAAKLGLGSIIGQGLLIGAGFGVSFAVAAAEAADKVQLYSLFEGLDAYSAGKRRVFLNGLTQLTANPTDLEKLTMQVLIANAMHQVDPLNPTSERYGIESFVDVNSKKIKVVIPTETDLMLDINNSRMMFKRYFSELTMITDELSMDVYVYNTRSNKFYAISTDNADYLNAFERVDYALDVAYQYWEKKALTLDQWPPFIRREDRGELDPTRYFFAEPSIIAVPSPEQVTTIADTDIPDNCFIIGNLSTPGSGGTNNEDQPLLCADIFLPVHDPAATDIINAIQGRPEPISNAIPVPLSELQRAHAPARTRTATEVCGTMALYAGISGSVTPIGSIQPTSRPSEDSDYVHMQPTAVRPDQINGPDRAPNINGNTEQPNSLDSSSAFDDDVNTASEEPIIINPEANHYLDGTAFRLDIRPEFTFLYGSYKKDMQDEELSRLGIRRNKNIAFLDKNDVRIDNIIFEGNDLLPSSIAPYVSIPQDGRYELEVCARAQNGELVEERTSYHILSSLLHRVSPVDGRQRVLHQVDDIDPNRNLAIFIPGVSKNSFLVDPSTFPPERLFGAADLDYDPTPIPVLGQPPFTSHDKWLDYDVYMYQSPAYLETALATARPSLNLLMRTAEGRFFDTPGPQGVQWYDTFQRDRRDNNFSDVANNPSPTTSLIEQDRDYFEEIFFRFVLESGDEPRVIAIYAENVSAFRMVKAVVNTAVFQTLESKPNIRLVLGLLDPVWDPRLDQEIEDWLFRLQQKEQVMAFVAHSQTPTLEEEIYLRSATEVEIALQGFVEYDWTFIDDLRIQNEHLASKFIYAMGANADIDMVYCTSEDLPNGTVIGFNNRGHQCYSTVHTDEDGDELGFTGYFGPYCELQRSFFRGGVNRNFNSYRFRGHNFSLLMGNEFEIVRDEDNSMRDLIIMEILNPSVEDELLLRSIITGN